MKIYQLDEMLRNKTKEAILLSRDKWKERHEPDPGSAGSKVTFLGTGGNPEAVIGQVPRTAGFFLHIDDLRLYVDPGIGAPIYANEAGIDTGTLDAVYISHGHTDHYAGAETIIEGMCWGMSAKRGIVLGPKQLFEEKNIISKYHQGETAPSGYAGGPVIFYLEAYKTVVVKGVRITPIPAYHGGENYGFVLEGRDIRLGYTSDTNYIRKFSTPEGIVEVDRIGTVMDLEKILEYRQDIKAAYSNVDVLIANITCHNSWFHRHITSIGLAHLLKGSQIKLCIMTHFNYCCVEPEDLRPLMADYVQMASGVKVRPAYDNQSFDLKPTDI